jgi:SAM-dependent methyltransferase
MTRGDERHCTGCGTKLRTGLFGSRPQSSLCENCRSKSPEPAAVAEPAPDPDPSDAPDAGTTFVKFEHRAPSAQNAVDVFRGRWASDLGALLGVDGTGPNLLFTHDSRPSELANAFGNAGSLAGMTVLEIGPLEAAHTYTLEKLGAESITTVESSVEAWLKCLVVKEILHLNRSTFLLGDAVEYLRSESPKFDIVMCSGVLYHMADPLVLIAEIARASDRCFVWTHYYDPERHPTKFEPTAISRDGLDVMYWSHVYGDVTQKFWGGIAPTAAWVQPDDILKAFRHYGLSNIEIVKDDHEHPNGPSFTFVASRPS